MGLLVKILLTAAAAYLAAMFVPGITIGDVKTALLVALVLALLNAFVKPILVLLTIPITVITLGLFLIVINILMIFLAAKIVPGFEVDGWLAAFLFSLVMAVIAWILDMIF